MVCLLRPAGCLIKRPRPSYVVFFMEKKKCGVKVKKKRRDKKCVRLGLSNNIINK